MSILHRVLQLPCQKCMCVCLGEMLSHRGHGILSKRQYVLCNTVNDNIVDTNHPPKPFNGFLRVTKDSSVKRPHANQDSIYVRNRKSSWTIIGTVGEKNHWDSVHWNLGHCSSTSKFDQFRQTGADLGTIGSAPHVWLRIR